MEKKEKKTGMILSPYQHNTKSSLEKQEEGKKRRRKLVCYEIPANTTRKLHSKSEKGRKQGEENWYDMKASPTLHQNHPLENRKKETRRRKLL